MNFLSFAADGKDNLVPDDLFRRKDWSEEVHANLCNRCLSGRLFRAR